MNRRFLTKTGAVGSLFLLALAASPSAFAASKTDTTFGNFDNSSGTRTVTFNAADFNGNALETIDLSNFYVAVNFVKADGSVDAPPYPTDTPYFNEIVLRLTTPTGTTVNLINAGSFNQGVGPGFDGTITFSSSAPDLVNVDPNRPQEGTFRPIAGDFSAIAGESAIGDYTLFVQDTAGSDSLRYRSFTVNVGPTAAPEPGTLVLLGTGLVSGAGGLGIVCRRKAARIK